MKTFRYAACLIIEFVILVMLFGCAINWTDQYKQQGSLESYLVKYGSSCNRDRIDINTVSIQCIIGRDSRWGLRHFKVKFTWPESEGFRLSFNTTTGKYTFGTKTGYKVTMLNEDMPYWDNQQEF